MDEIRERLRRSLGDSERYKKYNRLFAWGAGNTAALYLNGFERIKNDGIHIEAYVDSKSDMWGLHIGDAPVISPDDFYKCYDLNTLVLVMSIQPKVIREIGRMLDSRGIIWCSVDEYILSGYQNEVLRVYDLLDDEKSKEVYADIINMRMQHKNPSSDVPEKCQYFCMPEFWGWHPNEVFVDCGAYVGDSVEAFIREHNGVFGKIYAFEPDKSNQKAFICRVERLKQEWNISDDRINLIGSAVGKAASKSLMWAGDENNAGISSKIAASADGSGDQIEVTSLDVILGGTDVSFIKADIESYEYDMLLGAEGIIRRQKPKLAVCIYHNAVDLFSIPLLIKEICPEYRFSVRHHSNVQADTVLYAWVGDDGE